MYIKADNDIRFQYLIHIDDIACLFCLSSCFNGEILNLSNLIYTYVYIISSLSANNKALNVHTFLFLRVMIVHTSDIQLRNTGN